MDTVPLSTKNWSGITAYLNCSADGDNPEFSVLRANLKGLQEPPMRKR
jgi:hypothetical protein